MSSVLFGLNEHSSNEAICKLVFSKAHEARYFSMATLPAAGDVPAARYLDFMCCEDDGLIYFGVGTGKTCGEDLEAHPVVTLNGSFVGEDTGEAEHRSLIAFRISGKIRKADNPKAIEEYWARNPGSRYMWRKSLHMFEIYCLYEGEGEFYQVYKNDGVYRLRFGFGGQEPRPFRYQIDTDACVGCGVCREICTANIIELQNGKAVIPYHHCFECGACWSACPNGAVKKVSLA